MTEKKYHGSCHCGAVEFEAMIDLSRGTRRCNCSICTKARAWFIGIPAKDLRLLKGDDHLLDYSFKPKSKEAIGLHYRFCRVCGIRLYAEGPNEKLGPFYAVAIAALDNLEADANTLADGITYVDGQNDRYEDGAPPPADTRLM